MKKLFSLAVVGVGGFAALEYFGLLGSNGLFGSRTSSTGGTAPNAPAGGGGAANGPGPAAPPPTAAPPAARPPVVAAPPVVYAPAIVPPPAIVAPPIVAPPPVNVSTADTNENRMRAVTDRSFAQIFPVLLNADQWNYYRQNATGRQYDIDGMFNPDHRDEQMTAAVFLQRSLDVYGLSGLVYAMSGRRR